MEGTKLTQEIIESYGFESSISKPDWDDVEKTYVLPNGLSLSTLTVCNNEPCDIDSLEGLEGYIYINTKEELDELNSKTFDEICIDLQEEHPEFDIDEYI